MAVVLLLGLATMVMVYFAALQERRALVVTQGQLYQTIEWALNQAGRYDYGEIPLSGDRVELLRGLLAQLAAMKFVGTVQLETHVAEFCLIAGDSGSGWRLADPGLPVTECAVIGQPPEQSLALSEQQSLEFTELLTSSPFLAANQDIRLEIVALGASSPIFDYPADNVETAGDWNTVAQRNHRVRFRLLPAAAVEAAIWPW